MNYDHISPLVKGGSGTERGSQLLSEACSRAGFHHARSLNRWTIFRTAKGYNRSMAWQDRISVNPAVRSGKPCIKGTRITVYDVLEYLAGGMTEEAILGDFPDLTRDDIRATLAFAAARERRLAHSLA